MKKVILVITIIILLMLIFVLIFKLYNVNKEISLLKEGNQNYSTGAQLYDLSNTPERRVIDKKIWIPNDVIYVKTCCMYATTFASLKNIDVLKVEVEKILEEHYELVDGKYYDALNDFTIIDYGFIEDKIMNYIWFTY